MIKKEDIKIGSILRIDRFDLIEIASLPFVDEIDPLHIIDSFFIKIIDIVDEKCTIKATISTLYSYNVDMVSLAKVADLLVFKTETEKSDKDTAVTSKSDPLIMTHISANKYFHDKYKFFMKVKKTREMAKRQIPIKEVVDNYTVQSQLKATLDSLKDYIDVLKNEPDARSFKKITDEMSDTYKAKNKDYGNSFSNLFKECGMTYAYGHMKEKLERVKSLMKDEAKVKGEGMKDSLKDLANYAILTIMELERKEEK